MRSPIQQFIRKRAASPRLSDPSRNDCSFAELTALFDKVGIDLFCGDNICVAAGLVSV